MKIIDVKDLYFSYNQNDYAVNGVSFSVEKGSYTTIIGHNGSGKSTVAKLLAGLLPLEKGTILVDGETLSNDTIYKIRKKLGIVFQNPDNQFIGSTVQDDIAFGLENYEVEQSEMEAIIHKYASVVKMEKYLLKEPTNLSGGQKQRVAIAGVLAMQPEIIIFDEATSMLDPKGKDEIKKVIQQLHKDKSLTIISITHDIEEALNSDYCIVMNKGKVLMEDKPEKVFKDTQKILSIGLDIPYIFEVKERFLEKGIHLKSNTMEGVAEELWQLYSKK